MTKKSNSFYLTLLVVLTGALVLAPTVTSLAGSVTDESPTYVTADSTYAMLSFTVVNNTSFPKEFRGISVSNNGATLDDIASIELYSDSSLTSQVGSATTFDSEPAYIQDFTETISANTTETYYLAIVTADSSTITDGNGVSVTLNNIDTEDDFDSTSGASGDATVDATAPTFDAAITGSNDAGDSTVEDQIYLTFTDEGPSSLDTGTVSASEFTVTADDGTDLPVDSVDTTGAPDLILTLDSDLTDTGETPDVEVSGGTIADNAGNTVSQTTNEAADGLKPTVDSVSYTNNGYDTKDSLAVTFSEDIGIRGSASDYGWTYASSQSDGSSPDEVSLSGDTVTLTIDDQSLETPGDSKSFYVTVKNEGNVSDTNGNTVNPNNKNYYASEDVDDFVATTAIASAETASTSSVDVQFNEDIASGTLAAGDFTLTVDGTDYSGTDFNTPAENNPGEVTLTLSSATFATDATPDVSVASDASLEDVPGNLIQGLTATAEDGVAPVLDSAEAVSRTQIDVTFSEALLSGSADAADFTVTNPAADVDSATVSGSDVQLTLVSADELATDATPDVDYTKGTLADNSTNENKAASDSLTDATDGIAPELDSINWIEDNDVVDEVDEVDVLEFNFSETIDVSTFEINKSVGSGASIAETSTNATVTVTLAAGEGLSAGDVINPTSNVVDAAEGNAANTSVTATVPAAVNPVVLKDDAGDFVDSYANISTALNNVSDGYTIVVTGEYGTTEETLTVSNDLTIKAADGLTEKPVVDGSGTSADAVKITGTADVTLDGLEIIGNNTGGYDTVNNGGGVLTVQNCTLNADGNANAMALYSHNKVNVSDTTFVGSADADSGGATDAGRAVRLDGTNSDGSSFSNVTVKQLRVGIQTTNVSEVTVENSTFADIYTESVLFIAKDNSIDTLSVTGSDFDRVSQGVYFLNNGASITGTALLVYDNNFNSLNSDSTWDTGEYGNYNAVATGTDYAASSTITGTVDATENWWGTVEGPSGADAVATDMANDDITYNPWLASAADDAVAITDDTVAVDVPETGWNMISVSAYPYNQAPEDLFGSVNANNLFYWDGSDYLRGDEIDNVEPEAGFWYYASSSDVSGTPLEMNGGYKAAERTAVEFSLDQASTWYMISAPFFVDWGEVEVSQDDGSTWDDVADVSADVLSNYIYTWDTANDKYVTKLAPNGTIVAGKGYWVKTGENAPSEGLDLKLPFSQPDQPTVESAAAARAATAGFEPVPEGVSTPPAPPAVQGASGELEATAAATADAVTFEVKGADVDSIDVQVFSTDGGEVFSGSAAGNSLSWDANVANGVYLYGVSAEVNGTTKPLGIQKLLILS